jgi:hypothetical protein
VHGRVIDAQVGQPRKAGGRAVGGGTPGAALAVAGESPGSASESTPGHACASRDRVQGYVGHEHRE